MADPLRLLQIAQPLRHIGQYVAQHGERRPVQLKLARCDFVEGIGIGVMPVEVVCAHCADPEAGDAIGQQGSNVGTAAFRSDLAPLNAFQ